MEGMRNCQISDKIYSRTNKIMDNFYVRFESKKICLKHWWIARNGTVINWGGKDLIFVEDLTRSSVFLMGKCAVSISHANGNAE